MSEHRFVVLVCGGRSFDDVTLVCQTLWGLHRDRGPITRLVHGAATGADGIAAQWAQGAGIDTMAYPAKWGRFGRAAGPRRNALMVLHEGPDVVVAFKGGRGTADMVRRAKWAGVEVIEV